MSGKTHRRRNSVYGAVLGFVSCLIPAAGNSTTVVDQKLNEQIATIAGLLVANEDIRLAVSFDDPKLDYSVESLKRIDTALEAIHQRLPNAADGKDLSVLDADDLLRIVLRTGTYVGEVIRRASPEEFYWSDHDHLSDEELEVIGKEKNMGTVFLLRFRTDDGVTFPLAKILKYLVNGSEDSTYFYAQVISADLTRGIADLRDKR